MPLLSTRAGTLGRAGPAERIALIGLAAGARSTLGPAAALLATRTPHRPMRVLLALGVAGELVWDKLPQCPSRFEPAGVGARVLSGVVVGALLTPWENESSAANLRRVGAGIALGAASALIGATLGARWRRVALQGIHNPWPGALIEDAAALTVAIFATRP